MTQALLSTTLAILISMPAWAQNAPPTVFEFADVHPSPPAAFPQLSGGAIGEGRYELRAATMVDLIHIAWNVEADHITGGPSWLATDRFEIIAKAAENTPASAMPALLQTLLADRFGLQMHPGQKPLPAYVLTSGKNPRLKPAKSVEDSGCQSSPRTEDWKVVCHAVTMADFVVSLPQMSGAHLNRPVFDETGLQGQWDFDLTWDVTGLVPTPYGTSLFEAVDRQLGLQFEQRDVPMPVLVVDRVNRTPTPNAPGVSQSLPSAPTEFEVGIIKPSAPNTKPNGAFQPGGRVDLRGFPLQQLIALAWSVTMDRVVDAPKWAATQRFDVLAKAPGAASETGAVGVPVNLDATRIMLRALLIDRFSMKVHNEDRPVPVYEMVVSKSKLKKADPTERAGCVQSGGVHPGATVALFTYTCRGTTMPQLATKLLQILGHEDIDRIVVDATNLEGAWDFEFSWSPPSPAPTQPNANGTAPTLADVGLPIKDALNEQLGLKLERRNRPMPVLVIDHVDENPKN